MRRFTKVLALAMAVIMPTSAHAQNQKIVDAVRAVGTEWTRAYNAHDADAVVAVFDKPVGLFIFGGTAVPFDSLKAFHQRWFGVRTNEAWTNDREDVLVFSDQSALLTVTQSGHFTNASGVTWEFKGSAFVTALVQKRGNAWKVVAAHVSSSGTQVKK